MSLLLTLVWGAKTLNSASIYLTSLLHTLHSIHSLPFIHSISSYFTQKLRRMSIVSAYSQSYSISALLSTLAEVPLSCIRPTLELDG